MELYAVRNQAGKYFRAKGYGGYGDTWVAEIDSARIYTKIKTARAQVTYFANAYPQYGTPDLVKLVVTDVVVVDETARVEEQRAKKKRAEARHEARRRKEKLTLAHKEYEAAKKRLEELGP